MNGNSQTKQGEKMRTAIEQYVKKLLQNGLHEGVYTAAAAAVGCRNAWCVQAFAGEAPLPGGCSVDEHTLFDLASLTKIVVPTMIVLRGLQEGTLELQEPLDHFFAGVPHNKANITLEMLLTHTSGFMPSLHLFEMTDEPNRAVEYILSSPLLHPPGEKVAYSCTGFILLGKMLEVRYGKALDMLSREYVFDPLGMNDTTFCPNDPTRCAATECLPGGMPLIGTVHDENARFLHGVAGNAGVFMSLADGCRYASMLASMGQGYLHEEIFHSAIQNRTLGQSEHRGLGFQIAGTQGSFFGDMPHTAFGHTGFTGTSIVVEPESGFWVLLLTNRVYPTRSNTAHIRFRKKLLSDVWRMVNDKAPLHS